MYIKICLLVLIEASLVLIDNRTIAIIGTNDIHGAALPTTMYRNYQNTNVEYKSGGLVYMGRLINIIKNQYQGNALYLDAGDQFQGGIESSKLISSGKIMNDFFGLLEANASAIGNHQFDFGPSFLFPFMKAKDGPNLAANLRSEKNEENFLPGQQASQIYSFANGIKVGVIGLSTVETPTTTSGFSSHLFPQYKFLDYRDIVIEQSAKLRKNGAHAVLIVSHVGNQCTRNFTYKIWTKEDNQQGYCSEGEMSKLLKSLPEGTIQGVVQGHHHTVSHIFIDGIPVMGNINGGFYFNVMYLTFDENKQIVDAKIEGPIPVCEKIFQNTGLCNYVAGKDDEDAGRLVNWKFHNQDVYADPKLQTLFEQQWYPKMKPFLVDLVQNQILLYSKYSVESELGNLITDLIHENFTNADFVVVNPGGFRTQWMPGMIQEQHFFNMFPFDNRLVSFNISGKELLDTVRILQNGKAGLYPFYNIQCTVRSTGSRFQFVSARFMDGTPINENKNYIGVTVDFMIRGGDDFETVIKEAYTPRDVQNLGDFKQSIRELLKKRTVIKKGSLIDPEHPRLIIQQ